MIQGILLRTATSARARILALGLAMTAIPTLAIGQQDYSDYILGEEKRLEIVVHVLGEVQRPGEYRVPDNTTVLELLSRAGGGTQFANMNAVTITRPPQPAPDVIAGSAATHGTNGHYQAASTNGSNGHYASNGTNGSRSDRPQVFHVNIKDYLTKGVAVDMPVLAPGDVVSVPRNNFSKWKTAASVMRDLAVVVSTYLLYVKVVK